MKRTYIIAAVVVALLIAGVLALELHDPDVQTEAALPGPQNGSTAPSPSPCLGLAGGELVECRARYGNEPQMDDRPAPRREPERSSRADFGELAASEQTRGVADWIVRSGDNDGGAFIIIDKREASIYVFDAEGRAQAAAPVLLGIARGDRFAPGSAEKDMYATQVAERITPAGRFLAQPGRDDKGRHVIWIDYDAGIAMHEVLDNPRERRGERLATPTPDDNRISYGCVNLPRALFADVVRPLFERTRALVYVLPDTGSALELFASRATPHAFTAQGGPERLSAR